LEPAGGGIKNKLPRHGKASAQGTTPCRVRQRKGPAISTPPSPPPEAPPYADPRRAYLAGLIDAAGLPALVVLGSMIGFGSLARESGFTIWLAVVTTDAVWSLPGQMAMAELYAVGASAAAIAVAVSVANLRFLPMALAMLPVFRQGIRHQGWNYLLVLLLSVNTWTGAMRRCPYLPHDQRAPYYLGFSTVCMGAGLVGTAAGFVLAGVLPRTVTLGLVFLNPIYFALVFADVRQRSGVLALVAGAVIGPLVHLLSPVWGLVATGVIAGTAAYLLDEALERRRG
jgi:predicted branched-subunit amino acid permease